MSEQLIVDKLTVRYGSAVAVRDMSLDISKGSLVALLGPNGAGKTSLLSAIAGLVPYEASEARLGDTDIRGRRAHAVARSGLRLVPETRALFGDMTTFENLQVGAGRLRPSEFRQRLDRVFDLFPRLAERQNQLAATMSGGEQQMVSIARALVAEPKVLMLDEPSMGLAPMVVADIISAIGRLRDQGLTVLVSEQNARAVLPWADHAIVMSRGEEVMGGDARTVAAHVEVGGYLGGNAS